MNELYWITRCDSISTLSLIFTVIGIGVSAIFFIAYIINVTGEKEAEAGGHTCSAKEHQGYKNISIHNLKWLIPTTLFFILILIFVPTTKEALLIYGVGGTMDYIKSNPTAKKLPDKCIKALDKWVDEFSTEKKDSIKK